MGELALLLPMAAIIFSAIGLLYQHFKQITVLRSQIAKNESSTGERITKLETKMELFWSALERRVVDILKPKSNPEPKRKGVLLDKLRDRTLSEKEAEELKKLLSNDVQHEKNDGRKLAIGFILARLEQLENFYHNKG